MRLQHRARHAALLLPVLLLAAPSGAQILGAAADTGRLTIERVFRTTQFDHATAPTMRWLDDGRAWLELRAAAEGGRDVVRVDAATGRDSVVVPAARLAANGRPLDVARVVPYQGGRLLLVVADEREVIPHKTGAMHFVYDVAAGRLTPASTRPGPQLAAKISPDGRHVGFVRDNDLWVTELATGAERRLTTDGSDVILNGIADWVYDEELDLEDAWRWSPDGRRIAYWRFDQSRTPVYPVIDYLRLNPAVFQLRHPKPGQANSKVTVGVLDLAGGSTRWIDLGQEEYVPRVEWLGADSLSILRMPRAQNRVDLVVASAATGRVRPVLVERDSAWVNVDDPIWIDGGRRFLWFSDRSGWRQLYLYDRSGRLVRQVTAGGSDVTDVMGVDERRGEVYVQVAEPDPTQRRVWRYRIANGRGERLASRPGSFSLAVAPGASYGTLTHSRLGTPPTVTLVRLPAGAPVRVLAENRRLAATMREAGLREPEFFRLPMPDGTLLDAYRIVPANFDSTRRHPVMIYVYGGPASPTVADQWGDKRYFFHQMLAERGYVVVSVDPRGAAWRGRDFRKATFLRLGLKESQDIIDATRWLGERSWVDRGRVGIWGRSYGGFMTALVAGRGGDLFKVGLSIVPVTDWRLYDTIYTERFMRTPEENPEGYRVTAPLAYAADVRARLLIVTSTGDENVHPQNALQLADRLTAANKPFEMVTYVNRPHGLSGGNTRAHWYGTMLRYVLEHL